VKSGVNNGDVEIKAVPSLLRESVAGKTFIVPRLSFPAALTLLRRVVGALRSVVFFLDDNDIGFGVESSSESTFILERALGERARSRSL